MEKIFSEGSGFVAQFESKREKIWAKKRAWLRLHRSFRRSYREEYERPLELPGLMHHAMTTFRVLISKWRIFLPLLLLIAGLIIAVVGLLSEDTFVALQETVDAAAEELALGELGTFAKSGLVLLETVLTGGWSSSLDSSQQLWLAMMFVMLWLVVIYLTRQILAGHRVRMRDGLYNGLAPLVSSLVVVAAIFVELIPVMIVTITYSAAVSTQFLETPFYALMFFMFAGLMIIFSVYLLSSTLIALVAVSAPGVYPLAAMRTARDLMLGRRIKLLLRLAYLIFVMAVVMAIILLPLFALDLWLKSWVDWLVGWPVASVELLLMTLFIAMYATVYIYLFYRRLLAYDDEKRLK